MDPERWLGGGYFTPREGPVAGQLGPWSKVVATIGLDPRGAFMKGVHIVLGIAWLAGMPAFLLKWSLSWHLLLTCSICTLWYLPIGTALGLMQLLLLLTPLTRGLFK